MMRLRSTRLAVPLALALAGFAGCDDALAPEPGEALGGGSTTNTLVFGKESFSQRLTGLADDRSLSFDAGNSFFNTPWAIAPGSVTTRDGLGPTFNATSCSGCHFKDGRGRPPLDANEPMLSMLIRLSVPGTDEHGGPKGELNYGGQLEPNGIGPISASPLIDVPGEGTPSITYVEVPGTYADGTSYSLRQPTIVISDLAFGPMDPSTMYSARVAPAMIGLGLLEALGDDQLLAQADPDDADGDGISGRVNHVWDAVHATMAIGRFGWKAGQPSLRAQSAGAFLGDMGITTTLHPDQECPPIQIDCASAPTGGDPEIADDLLDHVELYAQALAVPMRTGVGDTTVLEGREVFRSLGCPSCHVEKYVTPNATAFPELANQTIRPFTDLLLHDMGEGLADHRPEFDATGTEWRTAPLWGLGRVQDVNNHTFFLHDGRARGVAEAVLWHGGEAEAAKEAFRHLSSHDREALVRFMESL